MVNLPPPQSGGELIGLDWLFTIYFENVPLLFFTLQINEQKI